MAKKDYYEVLGLSKSSEEKQIKKAYKRLAMKHHPDRNVVDKKAAEAKFKEIQEAYSVLSDSQKRVAYDQFGHAGVNGNSGFGSGSTFSSSGGFGDIFSDIFGQSSERSNDGADLRYDLEIGLKDVVLGTAVKIRVSKQDTCGTCSGTGARVGTKVKTCITCAGSGHIQTQQGFFAVQRTCHQCGGAGQKIESPCRVCRGSGVVKNLKTISVKIPAGVDNGNRICLSGEGEAGVRGGRKGDLYVQIHVKEHDIFEREGANLRCVVPVDFFTVALGGSIEVPTLQSKFKVKIPAGTQTGNLFRLRNKGVPILNSSAVGDIFCRIKVETPVNLSVKQRDLLQKFAESCGKKQHPESSSFLGKVKSFF